MVDVVQKPTEIARSLLDFFTPVYEGWQAWGGAEATLKEEAAGRNASAILEADIKQLGLFMISIDDRGTRIELGLMVDVLSYLRGKGDNAFAAYNENMLADELGLAGKANSQSGYQPEIDTLELPLSLRIALDYAKTGQPTDVAGLRETFLQFVHRLVLQDGNVTSDEIKMAGEVENMLRKLTE